MTRNILDIIKFFCVIIGILYIFDLIFKEESHVLHHVYYEVQIDSLNAVIEQLRYEEINIDTVTTITESQQLLSDFIGQHVSIITSASTDTLQ